MNTDQLARCVSEAVDYYHVQVNILSVAKEHSIGWCDYRHQVFAAPEVGAKGQPRCPLCHQSWGMSPESLAEKREAVAGALRRLAALRRSYLDSVAAGRDAARRS
jgi:hypothetical protein